LAAHFSALNEPFYELPRRLIEKWIRVREEDLEERVRSGDQDAAHDRDKENTDVVRDL
jgi:hypothetical protein